MKCNCGSRLYTLNVRDFKIKQLNDFKSARRLRVCKFCGRAFNTVEILEEDIKFIENPLMEITKKIIDKGK